MNKANNITSQPKALYYASQTGDKSQVSSHTKSVLRKFGLLHLLTPSGIHLSAIFLFIFLFIKTRHRIILYVIALLVTLPLVGLYSLKRIIYFHLINYFIKDIKKSFLFTFLLDLLIGGFTQSPLSYSYSFLCWGVIIFSNRKLDVLKNLFFSQVFISYFNQDSMNVFALIINPIMTSIFSTLFPLMSFNFWIFQLDILNDVFTHFLSYFLYSLKVLDNYLYLFNFVPNHLCFILPFINRGILVTTLVFYSTNVNKDKNILHINKERLSISLADKKELIQLNSRKIHFLDRTCKLRFTSGIWTSRCKKKALQIGGPNLL